MWAMGYRNTLWGSDYPHLEGTFGHTQKTLHQLFDDLAPEVGARITRGGVQGALSSRVRSARLALPHQDAGVRERRLPGGSRRRFTSGFLAIRVVKPPSRTVPT
jgi:hypothetical protein